MFRRETARNSSIVAFLLLLTLAYSASPASFAKAAASTPTRVDTILARRLSVRAESLVDEQRPDSAEVYYAGAAEIYRALVEERGDPQSWRHYVGALEKLGRCQSRLRKYEDAVSRLEKALRLARKHLGEKAPSLLSLYEALGSLYLERRDYVRAERYLRKAFAISPSASDDPAALARLFNDLGVVAARMGRVDSSLASFGKALRLARQAPDEAGEQVIVALNGMANMYRAKGQHEKALTLFREALDLEEARNGTASARAGAILGNMALVHMETGDFDLALAYFRRALAVKLKADGEISFPVANTYNAMGVCYKRKEDYVRAQECFGKALRIASKLLPERHPYIAMLYLNLGIIHGIQGDLDRSRELLEKALKLVKRARGEKNDQVAQIYENLGSLEFKAGHYQRARGYFEKSMAIAEELGDPQSRIAKDLYTLALLEGKLGHPEESARLAQRAIVRLVDDFADTSVCTNPPAGKLRPKNLLLEALELKSRALTVLYRERGRLEDLRAAHATVALAVNFLEQERTGYQTEGSKLWLTASASGLVERAVATSLQLYQVTGEKRYLKQVFAFTERAKAGVLREATREAAARKYAGIPEKLLAEERDRRAVLASLTTQLEKERSKSRPDSLRLASLEARRFEADRAYSELIDRFERDYPAYYRLKYSTRVPDPAQVQASLGKDTALLDYFWGDSLVAISVLTRERFDVRWFAVDGGLADTLEAAIRAIKKVDDASYRRTARALYTCLVAPLEPLLRGKTRLVVIPHGLLGRLPFEALLVGPPDERPYNELDYLLKHWDVSYHYSAALYLEGKHRRSERAPVAFAGFAPVFRDQAVATPTLASNRRTADSLAQTGDRSVVAAGRRFSELPNSENEVKEIVALFRRAGRSAVAYVGREARESTFKAVSGGCRFLHLATHSFADDENPALSGIVFSQAADFPEDGILYGGEIYALNLTADLVALSSCESGVGKQVRGEGMLALTRGFLYAGARNLLVSLWKVSDRHSHALLVDFYRRALAGQSYSRALREAKLRLISDPATAVPRLWAAFVLIGE